MRLASLKWVNTLRELDLMLVQEVDYETPPLVFLSGTLVVLYFTIFRVLKLNVEVKWKTTK